MAGYADLSRAGAELVRPMRTCEGGAGGMVICLGVGGLVDLEEALGLEGDDDDNNNDRYNGGGGRGGTGLGNVDVWVFDSRRPWHLANVFGGHGLTTEQLLGGADRIRKERGVERGRVLQTFRPGKGGIFVFDDGDVEEELAREQDAYCEIEAMPELGNESDVSDRESDGSGSQSDDDDINNVDNINHVNNNDTDDELPSGAQPPSKKRKSLSDSNNDNDNTDSSDGEHSVTPPRQKRRHSLTSSSPVTRREPSADKLRKQLMRTRRRHERVLHAYYSLGTSYSEPISSMLYSLASELGREDNELLWHAIVGVSSLELYGRHASGVGMMAATPAISSDGARAGWTGARGERIRAVLRDEVRRLNPAEPAEVSRERTMGDAQLAAILTHARSAHDSSIRLSPEPRFLLVRHWSLYEAMLHSPYLSARLQIWSDAGVRRLHKLLAKMGISLAQSRQHYVHMDPAIKQGLRERLLRYAPIYGLEGLLPTSSQTLAKEGWGFVRFWGWKACLSAADVGVVIGAVLELGAGNASGGGRGGGGLREGVGVENRGYATGGGRAQAKKGDGTTTNPHPHSHANSTQDSITSRFWAAYDALGSVDILTSQIAAAQHLHRAILRTGKSLIIKKQIHHLRAFRIAVVKEGPDVQLFTHPGALAKLALWIQAAVEEMNGVRGDGKGNELVLAGLDEDRGVYVVVGLGGGGGAGGVGSRPEVARRGARERAQRKEEKEKRKEARAEAKREEKNARRARRREARVARRGGEVGGDGEHGQSESESSEEEEEDEDESEDEDEDDEDDDEDEDDASTRIRKNRFGLAFLEVAEETGARVKLDSFEHSVVEVKKEDLSGFLEGLSMKNVVA